MIVNSAKFVRRTTLQNGEYRKNFRQIDRDVIEFLRSAEAKKVTKLMAVLYLSLIDASAECWEREGVLRFMGETKDGKTYSAWGQMVNLLGCGNSTASKALSWMHEQGIIGYFSGKNGIGIRIFINRAAASIGRREDQKILHLLPTPAFESRTPTTGTPSKDCYLEAEDTNKEFRAPENGADINPPPGKGSPDPSATTPDATQQTAPLLEENVIPESTSGETPFIPASVVAQLRDALEPQLRSIAMQAAANAVAREHERTRQWLDQHGLPKAARVAQREAYNIFKHQSAKIDVAERACANLQVGRNATAYSLPDVRPHTDAEIAEIAEVCVTMLEVQGKAIDETLAEISAASGGWVVAEDVPKVRDTAHALLCARNERSCPDDCTTS